MKDFWNIARWVFPGLLGAVLLLLISKPGNPAPSVPADQHKQLSTQFEQKLEHLEQAKASGESGSSEQFDAEEVNAGLDDMTANAPKSDPSEEDARIEGINFIGDEAVGQFVVHRYGRDMYVTMSGR